MARTALVSAVLGILLRPQLRSDCVLPVQPRPRPPFDSWPVQVFDPAFGFAWFAHPAVLVTQLSVERGTLKVAKSVHDIIDCALEHARDQVLANGGLFIIHDFRTLRGYDRDGRVEFLARMRQRGAGYSRGATVAINLNNALLKMAVQGANLVSALSVKASLSMVGDPQYVVRAEVRRPPTRGESFPGRPRQPPADDGTGMSEG